MGHRRRHLRQCVLPLSETGAAAKQGHDGAELDDDEGSLCVESDGDDGLGVHFCVVNLAFYEGEEVGQEWYAGLNRAI